MKATNLMKLFALAVVATTTALAVPVTMTRQEASNLHTALTAVQPGLSPNDTIIAADNINVLYPVAQAYQKAQQAGQRKQLLIADGPERAAKMISISEEVEKLGEEKLTLDLTPIDVSAEEIKEAKIAPVLLSVIRRYLAPPPPKK